MKRQEKPVLKDLQDLYQGAPIGLCSLDTNLRYLHINNWLAELNGLPAEAHLGRTIREVLPDVAAGVEQQLRKVMETGEPIIDGRVDAETLAHPRVVRNFLHHYYPNRSEDGRIVGVSCVVEDITKRKRVEEALRRAHDELEPLVAERTRDLTEINKQLEAEITERKHAEIALEKTKREYEQLVNSVKGIVWEADLSTFQFTLVSQEAERLLGYPCKRWIEEPSFWQNHIHPEDRDRAIEYCIQNSVQNDYYEFEYRMIAANGDVVWLRDLVTVVWDKVKRTKLQGVMVDITALKQAESLLAGQKSILEQIALSTPLSETLSSLCQTIEAQSDGLFCSILLLEGDRLRYGAAPSLPDSFSKKLDGMTIGPAVGSCGTAAFRKESVIVSDIATDPLWAKARHFALRHGLHACWSTPILSSEGSVLGTFAMYHTQPRHPYPKEAELVRMSTYLAGIAIERRRSEEALQARARQQALVAELGQSALTGLDLPTLMHNAVSLIAQTLEVEYCKVLELLPDGEEMILRAGFGSPADAINHFTVGAGLDSQAGYTLVSDKPVVVEDLRTETRFSGSPLLHQLGVISGMSVIISGKPHHYGVLGAHCPQLRTFTSDDIHLVQAVANVLALAIERKQAEETLRAIVEGTAAVTSADFFHTLLRHLTVALDAPYAFIAECVDTTNTRVRTLAFLNRGTFIENIEYALEGTPCEEVIAGKVCCHPEDVQHLFPRDSDLVSLGVQCYLGFPLLDSLDKVIGHLVMMSDQPVKFDAKTESLLSIFAARGGAELERKQVEEALRERTERSELIAAGAHQAIWDWDVSNHHVNFSPRWKEMRGFAPDEVSDREEEWSSRIHPDDAPGVMAAVLAHFEGRTEFFEEEYRIRCKDGSWKWILDRGIAQRDAEGHVVRMAGSESDITERKLSEEAIQESEKRYRTLVESSPYCIHEIDLNSQFTSMNPAGLRMMSVTLERKVIGRPYLTVVSKEDQDRVGKLLELANKGESSNFTFRAVNGRHFQSCFVPINNDKGTIVKLMGLTQDITEETLAKEALRYLSGRVIQAQEEERRHVARELHDDIGQRLALIAVDTQLLILGDQQLKPEMLAQLKNLRSQVETLSSDVHNLSHQLHPANLEQLGLITALKSFFRDMERKGRVSIEFSETNIPATLSFAISLCLYRIVQEAISNVVKHSRVTQANVELMGEPKTISLRICDSGVGFDPEMTQGKEACLGIVSMQERIWLVGGEIIIHSQPSQGTRINVHIPLPESKG